MVSTYTIDQSSDDVTRHGNILRDLWAVKKTILVLVVPLVLLPLPLVLDSKEAKCAYGLAIMAIFWITESLPLAGTALLPMVIFPLFGVMKASAVAGNYIKETTMFAFGGLAVAIAVESCNLHKRIALRTLTLVGSKPRWLMFGFMLPTWFLSMWISNTATTAMMIPVVSAVIEELRRIEHRSKDIALSGCINQSHDPMDETEKEARDGIEKESYEAKNDIEKEAYETKDDTEKESTLPQPKETDTHVLHAMTSPGTETFDPSDRSHDSREFNRLCKGFSLCVAYAANIGGTGSLSGTGPNIIMQGQAEILFETYGLSSGVNFVSWMIFALPGSFICLILAWMWLQTFFLGKTSLLCCMSQSGRNHEEVSRVIREEYRKMGTMSFPEAAVLGHFILLVLLWLTRDIPYVGGWGQFLPDGYVGDSAAAILIVSSLFVFPSKRPSVFCWRKRGEASASVPPLMTWDEIHQKFPWGVLLLIGGGFALAAAAEDSGLSHWIGNQLTVFKSLEPSVMNLILTVMIAAATEVTSNTATASLLLPIMGNLAMSLHLNPLFLMFPCVIATSFAFMLPVATPPNAIVFANGYIKVSDMAVAGIGMNIVCVLVLALAVNTWGDAYFDLYTLPAGFPQNSTIALLGTLE